MPTATGIIRAVVLNYHTSALTLQCVESLLKQRAVSLEIVVVDNSATDSESKALRSNLPRSVALVLNSTNVGYSAGNNIGLRPHVHLHKPELCLVINNDVCLDDQETIASLACALRADALAVAISPFVSDRRVADPRNSVQIRRCPTYSGYAGSV